MNLPAELKYTKSHEWVQFTGETTVRIGLTDFAQSALGSLVFVNLPGEGDEVVAGESFGEVESVKAVSDIYSPVSGTVAAVNGTLQDAPEAINQDPYDAWMIEVSGIGQRVEWLDAGEYAAFCEEES